MFSLTIMILKKILRYLFVNVFLNLYIYIVNFIFSPRNSAFVALIREQIIMFLLILIYLMNIPLMYIFNISHYLNNNIHHIYMYFNL